jgi:hypothetical protein
MGNTGWPIQTVSFHCCFVVVRVGNDVRNQGRGRGPGIQYGKRPFGGGKGGIGWRDMAVLWRDFILKSGFAFWGYPAVGPWNP